MTGLDNSQAQTLLAHSRQVMRQMPDHAISAAQKAILLCEPDSHLHCQAIINIGLSHCHRGQYEAAITVLNEALLMAVRADQLENLQQINNVLGLCYQALGRYVTALDHFEQSAERSRNRADYRSLIAPQMNIANLLFEIGEQEVAEQLVTEVAGFNTAIVKIEDRVEILLLKAKILLSHVSFDETEILIQTIFEILQQCDLPNANVRLQALRGRKLRLHGELNEAVDLLSHLISNESFEDVGQDAVMIYVELAKAWFSLGDSQLAMEILRNGLEKIKPSEHSPQHLTVLEQLAFGHHKLQAYAEEARCLQAILTLRRSSVTNQIQDRLRSRELTLKQEQDQLERQLQQRENHLLKLSRDRLNLLNDFAHQITMTLNFEQLGQRLYALLKPNLDIHFVSLMVIDKPSSVLRSKFMIDSSAPYDIPLSEKTDYSVQAVLSGKPIIHQNINTEANHYLMGHSQIKPRAQVSIPLCLEDDTLGVISMQSQAPNQFTTEETQLMVAISRFVSVATSNILSHEKVQQLNRRLRLEKRTIEQAQERIAHLAYHDSLTGLPNRQALDDIVENKITNDNQPFALVYIDLDGFKPINDHHGHRMGDLMLVETAKRLKAELRQRDFAFRVGGDEFVLVLSGIESNSALNSFLSRLLDIIRQPVKTSLSTLQLSASIGTAHYPQAGASLDELMHNADLAMYHIKRTGKGGVKV